MYSEAVHTIKIPIGLYAVFILLLSGWVYAAPEKTLELTSGQSSPKNITSFVSALETNDSINAETVLLLHDAFKPVDKEILNYGFIQSQMWFRVRIKNTSAQDGQWLLATATRDPDLLEFFERRLSQPDELAPNTNISEKHRHTHLLVELATGEEKEIYIRLQSYFGIRIMLQFLSPDDFNEVQRKDHFYLGVFVAAMLMLMIVNIFQYIATMKAVYIYYSNLIFWSALSVAQHDGFNLKYLWMGNTKLDYYMTFLVAIPLAVSGLQVVREATGLKDIAPTFDKLLKGIMLLWLAVIPLMFFTEYTQLAEILSTCVIPIFLVLIAASSYLSIKHNIPSAPFYIAGWLSYAAGTISFVLMHLGVDLFTSVYNSIYIYGAGILLEGVLLSMALAHQVRILQRRHEASKLETITLLEDRLADMEVISQLEGEKQLAVEEVHEKNLLMASTSHDIHQPLYAIKVSLSKLKDHASDQDIIEEVDTAVAYAEAILKDVIHNSRAELSTPTELISLGKVFNELFSQNYRIAEDKQLRVKFSPTTLYLQGSKTILMRILDNLIKNALRYTQSGRILCGVRRRNSGIEIQVLDTGPGISKDDIDRIQQPFERGKAHESYAQGYGLGLSIINTLCEQQGYRFSIKGIEGKGSMFSIFIPA